MHPDGPPRLGRGDLASAISEHRSDYLSVDTPSPTSLLSLSPARSCIVAAATRRVPVRPRAVAFSRMP